jgi:hypothetical protein
VDGRIITLVRTKWERKLKIKQRRRREKEKVVGTSYRRRQEELRGLVSNCLIAEPELSTPLIPKSTVSSDKTSSTAPPPSSLSLCLSSRLF